MNEQEVKDALNLQWGKYPEVKTYGSNQQFEITTDYLVNREGSAADSTVANKMFAGLQKFLPAGTSAQEFTSTNKFIQQSKKVGASISDDLKSRCCKSNYFCTDLYLHIYIYPFRDWRYSLGTIIALLA